MGGGRDVDTRPRSDGRRFLEDIPLCFVVRFLVLCVVEVVISCYMGFYRVFVWDLCDEQP